MNVCFTLHQRSFHINVTIQPIHRFLKKEKDPAKCKVLLSFFMGPKHETDQ